MPVSCASIGLMMPPMDAPGKSTCCLSRPQRAVLTIQIARHITRLERRANRRSASAPHRDHPPISMRGIFLILGEPRTTQGVWLSPTSIGTERNMILRIGPHGTHRQPKVDTGPTHALDSADRQWLICRIHRRFTETLDHRHSGQGAESRQAFPIVSLQTGRQTKKRPQRGGSNRGRLGVVPRGERHGSLNRKSGDCSPSSGRGDR